MTAGPHALNIVCPVCGGSGRVHRVYAAASYRRDPTTIGSASAIEACVPCDSTGWLPMPGSPVDVDPPPAQA